MYRSKIKLTTKILIGVSVVCLLLIVAASKDSKTQRETVKVLSVIDGDTIVVDYNGKQEQVRLNGMNTPETTVSGIPNECYGPEATERTRQLLEGKTVELESEPLQGDRDKIGRLLRYVYVDGQFVDLLLVQEGYAYDWTDRYPSKYDRQFRKGQKDAIQNKRGLWKKCYLL
jgi:micrococcal nuclease